jgi:hypothetical protein
MLPRGLFSHRWSKSCHVRSWLPSSYIQHLVIWSPAVENKSALQKTVVFQECSIPFLLLCCDFLPLLLFVYTNCLVRRGNYPKSECRVSVNTAQTTSDPHRLVFKRWTIIRAWLSLLNVHLKHFRSQSNSYWKRLRFQIKSLFIASLSC